MRFCCLLLILYLPFSFVNSQVQKIVEINSINVGDLRVVGFSLSHPSSIQIEAVGAGEKLESKVSHSLMSDPNEMFAYAWILNAKTRELSWRMTLDNTKREENTRYNRSFNGEVKLPSGEYELYYNARIWHHGIMDKGWWSIGKFLEKLLHNEDWYKQDQQKWYVRINGIDKAVSESDVRKYHTALKEEAVVSLTGLHDSEFRQEGFKLKKTGKFLLYSIGEAHKNKAFDYCWIVDASTSEKIWESIVEKSRYAGGAIKNRVWRDTLQLQPGSYWVYYIMDDSHSPLMWNANPPYDPDFYGITLTGIKGEFNPKSIEKLLKQKVRPIVQLTKLGDNEFVQAGFKLSAPMQIRISAIGEGRRGEMYDYGWIEDINTGEKVWEMNFNKTRHAGGADKNRLIDEIITLTEGSYVVYFITDNSHSYSKFNGDKPYNPSNWGITIYPADPKYRIEQFQRLEDNEIMERIIVQIIRVTDDMEYKEKFLLNKKTTFRIYAIGEGDWDEMFDYGWIEDINTGEKVWEMTYDKTQWAGGAHKNRKVDTIISLQSGEYILNFITDGSHSYNDWNDDAPDDPIHYGITLYKMAK